MYNINMTLHANQRLRERKLKLKPKDFQKLNEIIKDNQTENTIKVIFEKNNLCFSLIINPIDNVIITGYTGKHGEPIQKTITVKDTK